MAQLNQWAASTTSASCLPDNPQPRIRYSANMPLLLVTLIGLLVLGPGLYFWHEYSVSDLDDELLVQAKRFEQTSDWAKAADYVYRYLQLNPEDAAQWSHLAETYDKSATTETRKVRAIQHYGTALALAERPEQRGGLPVDRVDEMRCRRAELLIETGTADARQFQTAEEEIRKVHTYRVARSMDSKIAKRAESNYARAWKQQAIARYAQAVNGLSDTPIAASLNAPNTGRQQAGSEAAVETVGAEADQIGRSLDQLFERARSFNPADVELAITLASLYRNRKPSDFLSAKLNGLNATEANQLADRTIDQLVANAASSAEPYLMRYYYRQKYSPDAASAPSPADSKSADSGMLIADSDLRKAHELEPKSVPVLFAVAGHLRERAREAAGLDGHESERNKYLQESAKQYEQILATDRNNELGYLELGSLFFEQGDIDAALKSWKRGIARPGGESSLGLWQQIVRGYLAKNSPAEARDAMAQLNQAIQQLSPKLERSGREQLRRQQQLLQARFLFAERDYAAATGRLEEFLAKEHPTENSLADAQRMLFQGYLALRRWDAAVSAFRVAASATDSDPSQWIEAAQSLAELGRNEEAIECSAVLLSHPALTPQQRAEITLLAAEAGFDQQVELAPDQRNWSDVETAVREIDTPDNQNLLAEPARVDLLAARVKWMSLSANGALSDAQRDELLKRLRTAEAKPALTGSVWRQLALVYQQLNSPEDSDRAVRQFAVMAKAAGNPADGLLLESGLMSIRGRRAQARQLLEQAAKDTTLTAKDRLEVERGLVKLDRASGDSQSALQRLAAIVGQHDSADSSSIAQIIGLSLETGDLAAAEKWETKLRAMGGDNTTLADFYQAQRLLASAKGSNDPAIETARKLQQQLLKEHPDWPPAHLLQSLIMQRSGNADEAVRAMRQAMSCGDRSIDSYQRLVLLLFEAGREDEAETCLKEFRSLGTAASDDTSLLEVIVATGLGDVEQALRAAQKRAEQNPRDGTTQITLGNLFATAERPGDAEIAFNKAMEIDPTDARAYEGLFRLRLRSRQLDRALETLTALREKARLTDAQRNLVLAQSYARLAELAGASRSPEYLKTSVDYCRKALAVDPQAPQVRLLLADLLGRDEATAGESERILRDMLNSGVETQQARWRLASLLAAAPNRERFQESLQLLDQGNGATPTSNLRVKASLLLRSGGEQNLAEARRNLEALVKGSAKPADADRLLLARICEYGGDLPAAIEQYEALTRKERPAATYIASHVELLINTGKLSDAETLLRKLELRSPDSIDAIGLRALLMDRRDERDKIEPFIETYAATQLKQFQDNPARRAELAGRLGRIYTRLGRFAAAERWYAYLVKLEPGGYSELAISMARRGDVQGAINLCVEAARTDSSPVPLATIATALLQNKTAPQDYALAEPHLVEAEKKFPDNSDLLFLIGTVRYVQKNYEESARLYQRVIQLAPNHILALNNLANVLCEQQGKADEAIRCVDRALNYASPQASACLWDTKAMILLLQQRPDQAIPLLEKATSVPAPDPRHHFHLAIAYLRTRQEDKARKAFELAERGKFDQDILTPADQQMLADLKNTLTQKKS